MRLHAVVPALLAAAPLAAQQAAPAARADTVHLGELRVQAARITSGGIPLSRAPFAVQVVTRADLATTRPSTVADALGQLPGVSSSDAVGSAAQPTVTLRGFTAGPVVGMPQGVSVFVDGVRVNEPDASEVNWDLLPLDEAERVEVIRGPSGPFGKNALAGALAITTRRGGERELHVHASAGSFGRVEGGADGGGRAGPFDWFASGRLLRSDGWREGAFTRTAHGFAKLGWRHGKSDAWLSVTASGDSLLQAGGVPASWLAHPDSVPARYRAGDPRRINFTAGDYFGPRMASATAHLGRDLGGGVTLGANAWLRDTRIRQFNANFSGPDTRIATANRTTGAAAQLAWERGGASLAGGAELSSSRVRIEIFDLPNAGSPDVPAGGARLEDVGTNAVDAGGWLQGRVPLAPLVAATATARYDRVSLPFRDALDPSHDAANLYRQATAALGVDWAAARRLVLFAGWGSSFRAPVILELACADAAAPCPLPYDLGDDPPLRPVRATTWQGGARLTGGRLHAEAAVYRAGVRDDIFRVLPPGATGGYFVNLDHTRREGIEAALTAVPLPPLRLTAALALTRATFQTTATLAAPFTGDDDGADGAGSDTGATRAPPTVHPGDRFPMVPAVTAAGGASWSAARWNAGLEARYTGGQLLPGNENGADPAARLHGYAVVDAHAERWIGRAGVRLDVRNLFDARTYTFGVLAVDRLTDPSAPRVEPFLTPGLPRRLELTVEVGTR